MKGVNSGIFYYCTIQTEKFGIGHRGWVRDLHIPTFYYKTEAYLFRAKSEEIPLHLKPGVIEYIKPQDITSFVVDYSKKKTMFWED